ncbi:MAG: fibronectin type III domain-containing protein [Clostridiales bacterium]|nr:fibronectin type III domain-containing protein [Clostridiales bacterium]
MSARHTTTIRRWSRFAGVCLLSAVLMATGLPGTSLAYLSTGPTGDRGWYWQNPIPQGNELRAIDFIGANKGFAVGANGTVLKTDTAGVVWEALDSGVTTLLSGVEFTDANTGWVVGASGVVRKTSDGGATWVAQNANVGTAAMNAVSFVDADTGWSVGNGGRIRHTSNGGATTWTTQTSGTTAVLNSVDFVDRNTGWAVGAYGTLLKTTNGGVTWGAQTSGTTVTLLGVTAIDANTAWAVGASGTVLATADGGATWTARAVGTTQTLYDIEFTSGQNAWITGAAGVIRATSDGGATWRTQDSGTLALWAIAPTSAQTACVVGTAGTVLLTADGGDTWQSEMQGTTRALFGVDFVGALTGWIAGASGTIMRTDDGGESWELLTSGAAHLRGVDFVDGQTGWVVGDGGTILKTTNGGVSWTRQSSGVTSILRGVRFASADVGWVVGDGGTILKTTNGGATWVPQPSNTTAILYAVEVVDQGTVIATGASGTIRRTTDGGATWATVASGITGAIYALEVIDAQTWFVVSTTGRIRKTVNGGATWTAQTSGTTQTLWGIGFSDSMNGWVVGAAGTVLRTVDGGTSWSPQASGTTGVLYSVHAASASQGWLMGDSGAIRKTVNSGVLWTSVSYGTTLAINALAFHDANSGWAVGASGLLRRTRDGGLTWRNLGSGTTSALNGVDFVSADTGWVVGSAGVIRVTANGGMTWAPQVSGVTSALRGVDFVDAARGWAVGDGGVIRATTDGGATWTAQASGVTTILRGVRFVNATTGWAFGDGGVILRTTNGGGTWTPQTSGVASILHSATFIDANTGWVAGAAGVIRKTTDGGATWTAQASGVTGTLFGVFALDASRAWAVGATGVLRRTSDGGTTWTGQATGTANQLNAISFVDSDHGWIVGSTGTTLRTTTAAPPVTIASVDPAAPDGLHEWYVTAPTITLQKNESGITRYSWHSSDGPWSTYVASILAPEGVGTLCYHSIDSAGNREAVQSLALRVDTVLPTAPANCAASVEGTSAVTVSWPAVTDVTSGLAYYRLWQGSSVVTTTTALEFAVTGLTPDTEYTFSVTAVDVAGNESAASPQVTVRTNAIDTSPVTTTATTVPATPDGESGWFITVPSVTLSWTSPAPAPASVTTHYSWSSTDGPWSVYSAPFTVPEGSSNLHFSTHDDERVRDNEPTRTVSFSVDTVVPAAPQNVQGAGYGLDGALMSWDVVIDAAPGSGVARYDVYLFDRDGHDYGNPVATTTSNAAIVQGIRPNIEYWVYIRAVDTAGNQSGPSASVYGMTAQSFPPDPPGLVAARPVRGDEVFVAWNPPTGQTFGEVRYHVFRSDGGDWAHVGTTIGVDNRSLSDTNASSSALLTYAVSVQDDRGASELSTQTVEFATVETPPAPAPRGLRTEIVETAGSITLRWTPSGLSNLAGYHVFRAAYSGGHPVTLTAEPVLGTEYVDEAVTPYQRYWYSVAAVDSDGVTGARSVERYARSRVATASADPHALFAEPDSARCSVCHTIHNAPNERSLLAVGGVGERPLCETCHDGTGGPAVTMDVAQNASGALHASGSGIHSGGLSCSSCHNPHGSVDTSETRRLLDVSGTGGGNALCYTCHGQGSALPAGDMRVFEGSIHNTGVEPPEGGSGVTCLACHFAHGSPSSQLLHYDDGYKGCMQCHAAASATPETPDIQALLTFSASPSSRHDLLASDQAATGARMACQNCHNTHAVTAQYPLVDPYDPSPQGVWTGSSGTDHCLTCHDGTLPTASDTLPWVLPPLGPGGETTTTDIASVYLNPAHEKGNRHGAKVGNPRFLRPEMGYLPGDTLDCRVCHEPHGAANDYVLRGDVRSADGSRVQRGLLVYEIPEALGGGHDMRYFCKACHAMPDSEHPTVDITAFPIDCTSCHRHVSSSAGGNGL